MTGIPPEPGPAAVGGADVAWHRGRTSMPRRSLATDSESGGRVGFRLESAVPA